MPRSTHFDETRTQFDEQPEDDYPRKLDELRQTTHKVVDTKPWGDLYQG